MEGSRQASALHSVLSPEALSGLLSLPPEKCREIGLVSRTYPLKIPEYYTNLMDRDDPHCPIRLQAIPSLLELSGAGVADPLAEEESAEAPLFLKRYPKRGVLLANSDCAMYCRFCNRKRLIGKAAFTQDSLETTLAYLEKQSDVVEVIVSGGDPLVLDPGALDYLLGRLRAMPRIKVIRISTRLPAVCPSGFSDGHREVLRSHGLLWMIIHINHPKEITREFSAVIRMMREGGAAIVSQTVLLRGVNDCYRILGELFEGLVSLGVKPYYLFQLDEVKGAGHFKVPLQAGLTIMGGLRRNVSGLCIPHYMMDLTGGLGKVPLEAHYVKGRREDRLLVENLDGKMATYFDNPGPARCDACGECPRVGSKGGYGDEAS